ncbi:C1-like protein [Raphanus sativus]|nr:C1-like protein [Raphanus sativus]
MSTRSARLSPLGNHPLFSSLTLSSSVGDAVMEVVACFACNFSLDTASVRKQEIPSIGYPKELHEHKLHLLAKRVSFPCSCGKDVYGVPYLCHQCSFMIHWNCVFFDCLLCFSFK